MDGIFLITAFSQGTVVERYRHIKSFTELLATVRVAFNTHELADLHIHACTEINGTHEMIDIHVNHNPGTLSYTVKYNRDTSASRSIELSQALLPEEVSNLLNNWVSNPTSIGV